jgi:uncharacterized OB-fold protein
MPAADVSAEPVFDGLFTIEPPALLAGRCGRCGANHFPRQQLCPNCRFRQVESVALDSEGTVYSYTIVHASPPGWSGPVPYALGIVELLGDGIRVEAILTAEKLSEIEIGDRVAFRLLVIGQSEEARLTFAYEKVSP